MQTQVAGEMAIGNAEASSSTRTQKLALVVVTSLFFAWGFLTCLNDILIPRLKGLFTLTYAQSMLVQFCFFSAYFLVSLPAGRLVSWLGYRLGIVVGLAIAGVGALGFIPAAQLHSYEIFLGALFVLASGITLLQVAANPLVTLIGSERYASTRLTLVQGFNSLGTAIAPSIGAWLLISSSTDANSESAIGSTYGVFAGVLVLMALALSLMPWDRVMRKAPQEAASSSKITPGAWKRLRWGVAAIFAYVGAEVAIGSLMISRLMELSGRSTVFQMDEMGAAHAVSLYWGGAMVGRFIGAGLQAWASPSRVLMGFTSGALLCTILSMLLPGDGAIVAIVAVGFFNSIQFPTIFSLSVAGMGSSAPRASGYLCMAIVGGALIPLLQGWMADQMGLGISYGVPALCYAYLVYYSFRSRLAE